MTESTSTISPEFVAAARRSRLAVPGLLAVGVFLFAVLVLATGTLDGLALLLGAAGWLLAFIIRQPVALVAMKLFGEKRAQSIVVWFSGPAEELVRLGLVMLLITSTTAATWAGYGWGAIEIVFAVVNALAIASLVLRQDEKAEEARQVLKELGLTAPRSGLWGMLERVSASAMHLGFTLMLFASPWLVLVTLPLHSLTNVLAVRFAKKHLAAFELILLALGAVVLTVGIILTGGLV